MSPFTKSLTPQNIFPVPSFPLFYPGLNYHGFLSCFLHKIANSDVLANAASLCFLPKFFSCFLKCFLPNFWTLPLKKFTMVPPNVFCLCFVEGSIAKYNQRTEAWQLATLLSSAFCDPRFTKICYDRTFKMGGSFYPRYQQKNEYYFFPSCLFCFL